MDICISMTGSNLNTKYKFGFIWAQTELWEKQETKEHWPETKLTLDSSWWTVSGTTSHSWGVLVWLCSSVMHLQHHHSWRRCKAHPQGLLGFVWLLLGFLSTWHQEQGRAVGSDGDFLSLFPTLCQGRVLREYKVWKARGWPWNSWEYSQSWARVFALQSFPSATQMDRGSSSYATTLDVQIWISPSKEAWVCLYEVIAQMEE